MPHHFLSVTGWEPHPGMLIPWRLGQRSGNSSSLGFWTKFSGTEMQIPNVLSNNALVPALTPRAPEMDDSLLCWPGPATLQMSAQSPETESDRFSSANIICLSLFHFGFLCGRHHPPRQEIIYLSAYWIRVGLPQ